MWLNEKKAAKQSQCFRGEITVSGDDLAVFNHCEHRGAELFSPGGYFWRPDIGDVVLVIKDEETAVCGKKTEVAELEPGEVCIMSKGGAKLRLSNDGNIYITGKIITEGE